MSATSDGGLDEIWRLCRKPSRLGNEKDPWFPNNYLELYSVGRRSGLKGLRSRMFGFSFSVNMEMKAV